MPSKGSYAIAVRQPTDREHNFSTIFLRSSDRKQIKNFMLTKPQNSNKLFSEIKQLIEEARQTVAVNAATTVLYWSIGERVNREVLRTKRAEYGKELVKSLSRYLTETYGKGWSEKQLRHCLRFAETLPNKEILYALSSQLSWTHFRSLMYVKDELKRDFYKVF